MIMIRETTTRLFAERSNSSLQTVKSTTSWYIDSQEEFIQLVEKKIPNCTSNVLLGLWIFIQCTIHTNSHYGSFFVL